MKILIYDWGFFTKDDLYRTLKSQGIEINLFYSESSPRMRAERERFLEEFEDFLKDKEYDAFFTINFFPEFAVEANKRGILYICWTYDSPSLGGISEALKLETNRIFLFDSSEYEEYRGYDIKNLYYLPLAVNTSRLSKITVPPMARMKFYTDISFVGQLYQSDMDQIFPLFDEYSAGYVAAIINAQLSIYGRNIIQDLINPKIVDNLFNEQVKEALLDNLNKGFLTDVEKINFSNVIKFLLKAVTNKERVLLLTLLAKYHKVKLYTRGTHQLPGVTNLGTVDYLNEMPMVFKCSKINLNMSLRSIKTGIPQRVLDILGCGALALTNYQEDLDKHFKDNENILIYRSMEEALDKCNFYLKNDKEAERVRKNGYKLVREQFSFEHQLEEIWKTCGLMEKIKKERKY